MSFGAMPFLDPVLETNDDFTTPAAPTAATDKAHQAPAGGASVNSQQELGKGDDYLRLTPESEQER